MKGLIKILASVMIIMSSCINSAQAQFVGTFWVLPIDKDFPVGTKVVKLERYSGQYMQCLDLNDTDWKLKLKTERLRPILLVNGIKVELNFNRLIGADEKCCVYEAREGNRVHVLFCRPHGQHYLNNSPLNKVVYTYYDIPPTPNPEGDMLDAALQQGIDK